MKRILFTLVLVSIALSAYSQKNLSLGIKSGYSRMNGYNLKGMQYGVDVAYQFGYAIEAAVTGIYSPALPSSYTGYDYSLLSASLDLRFYLIQQEIWGTGPAIGGQFFSLKNKNEEYGADNLPGFNLGWHARVFITDDRNLQLNGGWRYTNAQTEHAYHLFYLGLAYTLDIR
ncbi:MAG: hypothetical protein LBJ17_01195 [Dysgonamonadaceae bacterium]|jgi:hypothetical protein|nr:hypothetical protein [Dysgonamonadaceae bacterium]